MSACQHLLCSAQVPDFECSAVYGMWHSLVSSERLRALGKHTFLLNTGRKEGGKRGGCCKQRLHI